CFARLLARVFYCSEHRDSAALKFAGRTGALCRQSVLKRTATPGSRGAVAVLVHHSGRETRHWYVVAAKITRALCSCASARRRWPDQCRSIPRNISARIKLIDAGGRRDEYDSPQRTTKGHKGMRNNFLCALCD